MADQAYTIQGMSWLNSQRGVLGTLTMVPGTGRQTITKNANGLTALSALNAPVMVSGQPHRLDVQTGILIREGASVVAHSYFAIDSVVGVAYQMTEWGLYNAAGLLIAILSADPGEVLQIKALTSTLKITLNLSAQGATAPTINVTYSVAGLGTAELNKVGGVQLSSNTDWTSTGAVVKSPKQIADAIAEAVADATPDLDVADIPNLPASKITSGEFDDDRIPGLPASKLDSGRLDKARLPADVVYDDDLGVEVVVHTTQTSYNAASSSDGKLHVLAV